jgi:hypothetical protein
MASVIRFARRPPLIRFAPKVSPEGDSREAIRSMYVLIGSFFVTAVAMCIAVVAVVSKNWTDVLIMSAFVLVFAVLKIGLANALMYVMLRFDDASDTAAARAVEQPPSTFRRPPQPKNAQKRGSKISPLRLAPAHPQPGAPASR